MYIISNNKKQENDNIEEYRNLNEIPDDLRKREVRDSDLDTLKKNNTPYYGDKNNVDPYFKNSESNWDKQVDSYKAPQVDRNMNFVSLTGDTLNEPDFKHNNMTPYFGSSVTQQVNDKYSSVLDLYTGSGNQVIKKSEQAPLFEPKKNMHHIIWCSK